GRLKVSFFFLSFFFFGLFEPPPRANAERIPPAPPPAFPGRFSRLSPGTARISGVLPRTPTFQIRPAMAQAISEDAIIIGEHFQLGKKIGEGSFGIIHEGESVTKVFWRIAVKLESVKTNDPQLYDECRVYRHLQGVPGIPNVHYFGVEDGYNVLCIDLLGPSLEDLFDICGRRFSVKTVAMLARQMVRGALRPGEFDHIPMVTKKNVTGTARYMSVNTHAGCGEFVTRPVARVRGPAFRRPRGFALKRGADLGPTPATPCSPAFEQQEQSRRDDLESLGFVFMYFLRGKLPWQGMNAETNAERNEMIGAKKRATPIDDLCA
ncbi:MAG: kinase-like domain-containing protein, partial [Olpidium bornovanus]